MKRALMLSVFLAAGLAAILLRRDSRGTEARIRASAAPAAQPETVGAQGERERLRLPLLDAGDAPADARSAQVAAAEARGAAPDARHEAPVEEPARRESAYEDLVASYLISLAPQCPSVDQGTVSIRDCGGCHTPPEEQTVRVWAEQQDVRQPLEGHASMTDVAGNVIATGPRRHGLREGPWSEYRPDGTLLATGEYTRDRRHGPWTLWSPEGRVAAQGSYLYGKREGPWTEFDGAGARTRSAEYKLGELDGRVVEWHPGGATLAREAEYYAGRLDGRERTYHANGAPARDGSYANGAPVGTWTYWDASGVVDTSRSGPGPQE